MASTRNRNTTGNYCLEQRQYRDVEAWRLYAHGAGGVAAHTALAGNGLMGGGVPARELASNATDVEGFLFGIGSTNLVAPLAPLTVRAIHLDTCDLYARAPVIMPPTWTPAPAQRPFPAP